MPKTGKKPQIQATLPDELLKWFEMERKKVGLSKSAMISLLIAEARANREQKEALITMAQTLKNATPEQIQKATAEIYGDPSQLTLASLAAENAI